MISVFGGFLLIYLSIALFVFPLQSKFYNPVRRTLFNAFFMSIRHLFHTIGMLAINAVLVILPLTLAPIMLPVMFLLGFPLLALLIRTFLWEYLISICRRRKRLFPPESGMLK